MEDIKIEFKLFAEDLAKHSLQIQEEVRGYFQEACVFSTWYLAVQDQAYSNPLTYLQQGAFPVWRLKHEIELPDQGVFRAAIKMCDSFLDGYVQISEVNEIFSSASLVVGKLGATVLEIYAGKGGYDVGSDAAGFPKIVTDSFYPLQLAEKIKANINGHGLVTGICPLKRKMIKSLIGDEVSQLARLSSRPAL